MRIRHTAYTHEYVMTQTIDLFDYLRNFKSIWRLQVLKRTNNIFELETNSEMIGPIANRAHQYPNSDNEQSDVTTKLQLKGWSAKSRFRGVVHSKKLSYTPKQNPKNSKKNPKKIQGFFFEDFKFVHLIWEFTTPRIQCLNPFLFIKFSYTQKNSKKSGKKSEKKIRKIWKNPINPMIFLRI